MTSEDERERVASLFVARLWKAWDKILDAAKDLEWTQFYKIVVSSFFVFDERETHPGEKFKLERNR